jgi:hypothetical protein
MIDDAIVGDIVRVMSASVKNGNGNACGCSGLSAGFIYPNALCTAIDAQVPEPAVLCRLALCPLGQSRAFPAAAAPPVRPCPTRLRLTIQNALK